MTSAPHPRLAEVFARVVEAPPHERAAVVDRECVGDPSLRQEVESLLAHDATLATFEQPAHPIDGPPIVPAAAIEAALAGSSAGEDVTVYAPGTVIDQFTIVHEIDQGGFGVVYLAMQAPPEQRTVALKVLEVRALSPRLARRFEEERRALANLNHPGIARLYSGGTTAAGHPYLAMEFIAAADGKAPASRITDFADRHNLTVRQRVEIFVPVCHAVQHAHQQRIIHRDLKPSNILVEERDGRFQPKVIDFGIARHLAEDRSNDRHHPKTMLTLTGEVVGTPTYMSPEQAAGEHVDTRSDVYSLGVVLYEFLCGTLPLPSLQRDTPLGEQYRAIREEKPVRPSKAVLRADVQISTRRGTDAWRLAKHLRGDLDTILSRALEKDPARRFPTANALAEDLQRYLSNQPIESRPHTLRYTLGKLARRHRTFVTAAATVFVSLVVAVVLSLWSLNAAQRAQQMVALVSADANLRAAQYELASDHAAAGRFLDNVPVSLRGWEWRHLQYRTDRSEHRIEGFEAMTSALAIRGDGKRLLVGDRSGITTTYDAVSLIPLAPTVINPKPSTGGCDVWSVAWSPAGDLFATGSFDGVVRLYHADGSPVWKVPHEQRMVIYGIAFSLDGRWLAVGGGDPYNKLEPIIALHDATTGAEVWHDTTNAHTAPVTDLAFSPDCRWLASSADDQTVQLWRLGGSVPERAGAIPAGAAVNAVAFSPDSSLLAAGTMAREIRLYRVPSRELACTLQGHESALASVAFHPDGHSLASASWDCTVRLWSVPEGQQLDVLRGHRLRVNRVAFAPGGRLFSASDDRTVREWNPTRRSEMRSMSLGRGAISSLGVLADGNLVVLFADNSLSIVASADDTAKVELGQIQDGHFAISHGGSTIAWRAADDCVYTWRAARGPIPHPHPTKPLRTNGVSALDDRHLILACDAGLLRLDHAANRWDLLERLPPGRHVCHEWLDADGRLLATVWYDDSGDSFGTRDGQTEEILRGWCPLLFSGGRYAVLANREGRELAVYDNASGRLFHKLIGHREKVKGVAFSPNDERLASVDVAGTLRIWDWRGGKQVLSIPYPTEDGADQDRRAGFSSVAWSPDGNTLVTGSTDGLIHFWPSQKP